MTPIDTDKDKTALLHLAMKLEESGEYEAAFKIYLEQARKGNALSQDAVATCYSLGEGVTKDDGRALYWYKRAWKGGADTSVCMNIASVYAEMRNFRQVQFWLQKAVALGDGDAALDLADRLTAQRPRGWDAKVRHLVLDAQRSRNITEAGAERARNWFQLPKV